MIERTPSSFGEIIKNARVKKGVLQYQVAQAAGVSPPLVSLWETGERTSPPSPKAIVGIAKFLGLDPLRLLKIARPEDHSIWRKYISEGVK